MMLDHKKSQRLRRHRRGMFAEYLASALLMLKGYQILAHRYKTPVGEIDLIAKRGRTLAFIEVKLRKNKADAAEAIHAQNQQRVVRAAQYYLHAHPEWQNFTIRFDALLLNCYFLPQHLPHAFTA